jgi:hypothetical protein
LPHEYYIASFKNINLSVQYYVIRENNVHAKLREAPGTFQCSTVLLLGHYSRERELLP